LPADGGGKEKKTTSMTVIFSFTPEHEKKALILVAGNEIENKHGLFDVLVLLGFLLYITDFLRELLEDILVVLILHLEL
jgi:hypothetical protein